MTDEWLGITEASKLVNYHPDTLRDLAKTGKVKSRKVVTVWQIRRSSLLAYLRNVEKLGEKRGRKKRLTGPRTVV